MGEITVLLWLLRRVFGREATDSGGGDKIGVRRERKTEKEENIAGGVLQITPSVTVNYSLALALLRRAALREYYSNDSVSYAGGWHG